MGQRNTQAVLDSAVLSGCLTTLRCSHCMLQVVGGSRWIQPDYSLRSIKRAAQDAALLPGSCSCFQPPGVAEPLPGNPLWALFQAQRKGPVIRKWSPYMDIYHR